jgi:hypothetical protein
MHIGATLTKAKTEKITEELTINYEYTYILNIYSSPVYTNTNLKKTIGFKTDDSVVLECNTDNALQPLNHFYATITINDQFGGLLEVPLKNEDGYALEFKRITENDLWIHSWNFGSLNNINSFGFDSLTKILTIKGSTIYNGILNNI